VDGLKPDLTSAARKIRIGGLPLRVRDVRHNRDDTTRRSDHREAASGSLAM
jgi:hypothetical protein